jgi:hypothetical protein
LSYTYILCVQDGHTNIKEIKQIHSKVFLYFRIVSLDLSDCNIDDECLAKLLPIVPQLEELNLSDNFLTWYGLRKMAQPHKRTKRLRKLDLARSGVPD